MRIDGQPGKGRFLLHCLTAAVALAALPGAYAASPATQHFSSKPEDLYAQVSGVTPPEGSDVLVFDDEDDYAFDADGNVVHTEYVVYKVLSRNELDGWSALSQYWEPWHQDRPTLRARVVRPDGTTYALDPKVISDSSAAQESSNVYSDRRVVRAPLPAISQGSVVEMEIVAASRPLFPGAGSAASVYIGRTVPVQHTRLSIEAPASLDLHYRAQMLPDARPEISTADGQRRWVFDFGPTAPFESADGYLPPDAVAYPAVIFSTAANWQTLAHRYAGIVDQSIAQADVHTLVDGLIRNKATRMERIASITDYINAEIRYTGIEFGEAAVVPHTPKETLASKYGDCKDKAALLVAMLRAADIPANLALLSVSSRQDLYTDLPTPDFFDHAIVYVPGAPDMWIDATARYARLGHLPTHDQGRYALVISDGVDGLKRIPEAESGDNQLLEEREIDLAEYGAARVIETSRPRGSFESLFRDTYADDKDKDTLKQLGDYMQSQYLAEALDHMERSDPQDLNTQFELRLESKHAKRGFTGLDTAVAAIRLESLFANLPSELKEVPATDAASKKKKRTFDFYLRTPFVTEWRYHILPPDGFQLKALPPDVARDVGPAKLVENFSANPDGSVRASLRFDTVKRRFTPAEVTEISTRVAELSKSEAIMIRFEPTGQALLQQGKAREAFLSYRDTISRHPQSAVQHLRRAYALLTAGLGEAARAEARTAVRLDPKSALAQASLGYVLEHDLVGRRWRTGSDYAGAIAALRAAQKLEPDDADYTTSLAYALEYNTDGIRYGAGADLDGAAAEFRKLSTAQLDDLGFRNNASFDLFYAGRFAEAQKEVDLLPSRPQALAIACAGALNGFQAAIAEANRQSADDEHIKKNLVAAGDMLEKMRLYGIAADLLEAGAQGDGAAHTMNAAALARGAKRHENLHFDDTPAGTVQQWFAATIDGALTPKALADFSSRNLRASEKPGRDDATEARDAIHLARGSWIRGGMPIAVVADILMQQMTLQQDGNDSAGYRITVNVPGDSKSVFYLVRESGRYRLLTTDSDAAPLGLEALDRIAANKLDDARQLLDWARDRQRPASEEDMLKGPAFPRLWTRGQNADAAHMTLAAAALLVQNRETAPRGMKLLQQGLGGTLSPAEAASVRAALVWGYTLLLDPAGTLQVAEELVPDHQDSTSLFLSRTWALRQLGRVDEADALARARLAKDADDADATHVLVYDEVKRGDYAAAYATTRKLADSGRGGSSEWNDAGWYSLFFDRPGGPDIDAALKATEQKPHNFPVLHTLASSYAAAGKTREAYQILLQAMDSRNMDEPDGSLWYVLGRIAEDCGESELAADYYNRVTPPEQAMDEPTSTYHLAQHRLSGLKSTPTGART